MNYSTKKSLASKLDSIHDLMFDSCGCFFIKDLNSKFLYLNKNLLDAGGGEMSDFLGKTDYALPWHMYGEKFIKDDNRAIHEKNPIKVIELTKTYEQNTLLVATHKKAFFHENEKIGVWGTALEFSDTFSDRKKPFSQESTFFDVRKRKIIHLTTKQKKVTFYLLQGFSAKEVASKLFLSKRTIENHINTIKDANGYDSTKELLLSVRMI